MSGKMRSSQYNLRKIWEDGEMTLHLVDNRRILPIPEEARPIGLYDHYRGDALILTRGTDIIASLPSLTAWTEARYGDEAVSAAAAIKEGQYEYIAPLLDYMCNDLVADRMLRERMLQKRYGLSILESEAVTLRELGLTGSQSAAVLGCTVKDIISAIHRAKEKGAMIVRLR
jgi:DNA-directed RNA polymerase specialized sigma24 family protein